jgi:3-hydroxyacyl-CoA dehydrogenase
MNCRHYEGRDTPAHGTLRPVGRVGIIGANAISIGVAMRLLDAHIPVTLFDPERASLDGGIALARSGYQNAVTHGELMPDERDRRMALLAGAINFHHLKDCDLIVDATRTDRASKAKLFRRLDQVAKPGAVLMTDASRVGVDDIAGCTRRSADVLGLQLEGATDTGATWTIVPGKDTSGESLGTVIALARRLDKVAVVCGVCHDISIPVNSAMAAR